MAAHWTTTKGLPKCLHREHMATFKFNTEVKTEVGGGRGRAEANAAEGGALDVRDLARQVAEALAESGQATAHLTSDSRNSGSGSKLARSSKDVVCGRCGKKGHIKKDCPEKCKACGLKSCGGVKGGAEKCMRLHGIPPRLAGIGRFPGRRGPPVPTRTGGNRGGYQ